MDDVFSLGTDTATWAIKGFSVALRQRITEAAQRQGCTVADWLHGHFQKHGVDGQQFNPVKLNPVEPSPSGVSGGTLNELRELAAMARALTPEDRDSAAMRKARSIVLRRLTALEQAPAPPPLMIGSDS